MAAGEVRILGALSRSNAQGVNLFGRCPLFDSVVKNQMLTGKISPEQAFAQLDSHNCPIIRGASITSPEQLQEAAEESLQSPAPSLFGRCQLFDRVVKDQMLQGLLTPEQAFAQLDSHDCPIIRGASITSAYQLEYAVQQCLRNEELNHKDHPNREDCLKIDDLARKMRSGRESPKTLMDELATVDCPTLTSCKQFARVKKQYVAGKMTPSEAVQELVLTCPFFAPAVSLPNAHIKRGMTESGPRESMADECRRLSDMLYTVDESKESKHVDAAAKAAIEKLCSTKVPLITNCPLFQGVRSRYLSGKITAREAVSEMKGNCPILSKELNPGMLFNFEEYGNHREVHYDAAHTSHSHSDPTCGRETGCCCRRRHGASARNDRLEASKEMFARINAEDGEPEVCMKDGPCGCDCGCSHGHDHDHDSVHNKAPKRVSGLERLLGGVFPKGNPAAAAMLATFYISLFPNLILFATPSSIPNKALRIMVGFAVGGLLGDVFLHLMPHMFSNEHEHDDEHGNSHGHGHGHSHVRNTVFGCTIFLGLMTFFVVDKFMRLFGSEHSHSHGHSHDHGRSHSHSPKKSEALGIDLSKQHKLRKRRSSRNSHGLPSDASEADDEKEFEVAHSLNDSKDAKRPVKLSAYLNLIADAAHNFTDGLAMSASFYLSHAAGLSTFVAVFFHEIPHELGDFAILVQSGFSRTSALASQFFTALGAIAGTVAGIMIEETGKGNVLNFRGLFTSGVPVFVPSSGSSDGSILPSFVGGLLGLLPSTVAGVPWSQLVIPFTAGGFIYVGTVSVLPDLLQPDTEDTEVATTSTKGRLSAKEAEKQKIRRGVTMALVELGAMLVGLAIMAVIALSED
ncbi:hypothetical protein GGI07_000177 [Coemansia sp. Benny D115]|nr:hypothetical protein GGI07_000177 [Coemansia sp. Benny D115]